MGLGGFSSHDLSFGFWNSPTIEAVAVVFMMLSGVNFALYFAAWKQRSLRVLWDNVEVRGFYLVVFATVALVSLFLTVNQVYPSFLESLRHTVFNVVSIATTTGYASVRLCPVAAVRAGAHDLPGLLCHLRGLHRRRHQDGPHDRCCSSSRTRAGAHRPSQRGESGGDRRLRPSARA